ncbi:MAG: phospho-N-acetylmuramoyl-pentapeptide-transferase [Clostridia bacterium]|nr:phospho-N-acetylmuramoyl-pentapeptide-transferase [Clostridia bacterium]
MVSLFSVMGISFIIAAIAGVFLIPFLHKLKFGQEIREEGPSWHKKKSGTPTMGGFIFITATLVSSIVGLFVTKAGEYAEDTSAVIAMLAAATAFGVIGFLDDYIKVILKRNLGLRAGQKFSLQFFVALIFAVWLVVSGLVDTKVAVPFVHKMVDLGYILYIPFIIVVMLAAVNSVNLTDGLDGLAGTVTLVVSVFYLVVSNIEGVPAVATFAAALIGGILGFLLYNKFPARVFMGDTGSLFLGGAIASMAIFMKNPVTLLIVGFVYVAEALSVIIQVAYFKKTGKRIFKMSPIHHHFEMCGWSEYKIVLVFAAVTALLCIIGFWA